MAVPRKELVNRDAPGFYHVMNRCVRRAYLCGEDKASGRNYDHRKDWIEARILELSDIFALDVYAYSVMSNHYHVVVYLDPQRPQTWRDEEVAERWLKAYPGKLDLPENIERRERKKLAIINQPDKLKTYRKRLGDLSWFMGRLNEPLAKRSNQEDFCSGKFWEGRYTSQALLDEGAVFSCMAYVDLNPIRAGITEKLEESNHTSIKQRIEKGKGQRIFNKTDKSTAKNANQVNPQSLNDQLTAMQRTVNESQLTIPLKDYLQLVEWTGQSIIHPNKASIPAHITPILERLNLQQHHWLNSIENYGKHFKNAVGPIALLRQKAEQLKLRCLHGISAAKQLYINPI